MSEIFLGDWAKLLTQPDEKLPELLEARGIAFALRKEFAPAVQAATKLRELENSTPGQLYNAACLFAMSAASVVPDKGQLGLPKEQAKQRQQWIDEAMATLKQSINAGYDDFDHMRNDKDLMILRELAEFKLLGNATTADE